MKFVLPVRCYFGEQFVSQKLTTNGQGDSTSLLYYVLLYCIVLYYPAAYPTLYISILCGICSSILFCPVLFCSKRVVFRAVMFHSIMF